MSELIAWSPIIVEDRVTKGKFKTIPVGAKVSKQDIGDDWNDLVACGVLRKEKYPEDVKTGESPRQAQFRKLNEQREKLEAGFRHELEKEDDD